MTGEGYKERGGGRMRGEGVRGRERQNRDIDGDL